MRRSENHFRPSQYLPHHTPFSRPKFLSENFNFIPFRSSFLPSHLAVVQYFHMTFNLIFNADYNARRICSEGLRIESVRSEGIEDTSWMTDPSKWDRRTISSESFDEIVDC